MELSVVIPTCGRVEQLEACLEGLVSQHVDEEIEVLVGVDGEDEGESAVFQSMISGKLPGRVLCCGGGPAATRNMVISHARGRNLLLLNDDVVPQAGLVHAHIKAQQDVGHSKAMILGSAPWAIIQPDRLFDRLIRETSMVFFYDQMNDHDPHRDWGFRHGWTLNLSVATDAVRDVGGFCEHMVRPVYEDLELAWRLKERFAIPLLYRPEATVTHVHRYEPLEFLHRDAVLGHQAYRLAEVAPGCAAEMFGRDVRSDAEVAYSREFLQRHEKTAQRLVEKFVQLAEIPADAVGTSHAGAIIGMIYEQGLMIRRYLWRSGHVAAAEGRDVTDAAQWLDEHLANR